MSINRKILEIYADDGKLIGEDKENPKNRWQRFAAAGTEFTTKDETIILFCKTPRSRNEIAEYIGIHQKYLRRFIAPLVEYGRLKMTIPDIPCSINQRFYSGDADVIVFSETAMVDFCQIPRSRKEAAEHFQVKRHHAERCLNECVRKGKLKMTMPINPDSKQQRFVDSRMEIEQFTEEALLDFCKMPRSKEEISNRFGLTTKGSVSTYINPLLENGKLKRTHPEYIFHKFQRFYSE